jgi:hypothetical protein
MFSTATLLKWTGLCGHKRGLFPEHRRRGGLRIWDAATGERLFVLEAVILLHSQRTRVARQGNDGRTFKETRLTHR